MRLSELRLEKREYMIHAFNGLTIAPLLKKKKG